MGSSCWRAGREVCRGFMRPWQIGWQESAAAETSRASQNIETRYSILNFHVSLPSNVKNAGSQWVRQMFVTPAFVCACLDRSLHTSQTVSTCPIPCLLAYLGLHVFDSVNRYVWCSLSPLWGSLRESGLFVFLQHVVLTVVVSLRRDVGSLVRAICHSVSCCDLELFVCVFVLIIMGCSLLLSHFLFIVLILALGSSLTSQGCLQCGN